MDDVYVYYVQLPDGIDEAVLPCIDGYTIYIDSRQSKAEMERAYKHAMEHITNNDFDKTSVDAIETEARRRESWDY